MKVKKLFVLTVPTFLLFQLFRLHTIAEVSVPTYTAEEALAHIGEHAKVVGKVFEIYQSNRGNIFLNIGGNYPNQKFAGVIFNSFNSIFPDIFSYEGKIVEITGRIQVYKGKPEVIIRTKGQLKIK